MSEIETAKETVETAEVENADLNTSGVETNDADFEDTTESDNKSHTEVKTEKPKQTKEQNSEYARKRREAEREAELKSVREQAIIDALGGINPYTSEPMKDSADVEEYLTMKEIDKNGGDALADYSKYAKEKERKKVEKEKKEAEEKEWYKNDRENFTSAYPDVNLDNLLTNPAFVKYADGKVGKMPLADIYSGFNEIISEYEKQAQAKAAQIVANKKASVGSLSSTGTTDSGFFTKEQVQNMTKEEIHRNYDKIRESMSKWK